jgi:hypothetical protein
MFVHYERDTESHFLNGSRMPFENIAVTRDPSRFHNPVFGLGLRFREETNERRLIRKNRQG